MNEKAHELEDESSGEFVKSSDPSDVGEDGVTPLSGDKPFFDMVLMKSAVKPLCHMVINVCLNYNIALACDN